MTAKRGSVDLPDEVFPRLRRGVKPPAAAWVPTLYLAMGLPFAMVNWVVGSTFKDMGYSDTAIMAATGSIVVV